MKEKETSVMLRLSPAIKQELLDICKEDQMPQSQVVRQLIRKEAAARRQQTARISKVTSQGAS